MDFPELLIRMVLHLLALVAFISGTETHKGVTFIYLLLFLFFTYICLLGRFFLKVLQALFIIHFHPRKRNLKYLSTGYYFLNILSTSARYVKWLNPF